MTQLRKMMLEELQRRNYSQTTVNALPEDRGVFCQAFRPSAGSARAGPRSAPIRSYLLKERKLGARTVGHHTAALRFFFCKTLKRAYPWKRCRIRRRPRRLPIILTQEEAIRLIDSASNLFHRAMLMTIYSTGMRTGRDVQPQGRRYRQRPHAHPHPAGQRSPGPGCAAESETARDIA